MFKCSSKILKQYFIPNCKITKVNSTLPSIENIKIESKNNQLYIYSTNLETTLITQLTPTQDLQIDSDFSIILHGKILKDIISKLPENIIHFDIKDNNLIILGDSFKFSIALMNEDDFAQIDEINLENLDYITFTQKEFKDIITKSSIAISPKEQFQAFLSIYIDKFNDNILFSSTDRRRIAYKLFKYEKELQKTALILKSSLLDIKNSLQDNDEKLQFYITENEAVIRFDNFKYIVRLVKDKFPPVKDFLNKKDFIEIILPTQEFKEKLSRISVLNISGYDLSIVNLQFIQDKLILTTKDETIGTAQELININYKGSELNKSFNSRYILDFLNVLDDENFVLKLQDLPDSLAIFENENKDFIYVLAPVQQ